MNKKVSLRENIKAMSPETKPRILIVDDEEEIREVFGIQLRGLGYDVFTASSAEEAEAFLSRHQVELMLLDIRMPGKTGIEFLRELKPKHPEIGVLIITAIDDLAIAVEAMGLGAYDYITKPLDIQEMEVRLIKAYERWKLEEERREYDHKLEVEVKARTEELMRRINELEALNKLFQQHLSRQSEVSEKYGKLAQAITDFIQKVQPLLEKTTEQEKGNLK